MYADAPYIQPRTTFDVVSAAARVNMYRLSRWGAPRLRASSTPAGLLPFRPASSLSPLPALVRVTAATLPVAALRARCARPRNIAAAPYTFPLAGVRAPCGHTHPATQPRIAAVRTDFRRSNVADVVALTRDENLFNIS